jgi:hypothetical protein
MNPLTGKPVAVVPSTAWVTHPDASQFGSCSQEGWARGLAKTGDRAVITCAAGHIFEPERPENQSEVQAVQDALSEPAGQLPFPTGAAPGEPATTGDGATAPESPAEQLASGEITPTEAQAAIVDQLIDDQLTQAEAEQAARDAALDQIELTQGMILHLVTRIARHIGLPPERLDTFTDASIAALRASESDPAVPAFPAPQASAPGDLSSQLYGLAGQSAMAHHPGNDPQAFASWFNAAEYGDPGNG